MRKPSLGLALPIIAIIVLGIIACTDHPTPTPTSTPTPTPTSTPTPTLTSTPTPTRPLSSEQIVKIAKPYTVLIEARLPGDREARGTGIIFNKDGWIVTNAHVVEGAAMISVRIPDRSGALSAQLFGVSPCDDLAVIKVPGSGFPEAQFGDSNELELGEQVMVVGYPLGQPDLSVTGGMVSKLHVTLDQLQDLIQTDASVNPGNSGGPLLNMKGQVVGIVTLKMQYDQAGNPIEGTAFAISSNLANEVHPVLVRGENRNWVGLNTIPLKEIDDSWEGLLIIGVADNSPAEKAGLQPLDVLLTMQGVSVNSEAELCAVIKALPSGQPFSYEITREGEKISSRDGKPPPTKTPIPLLTPTPELTVFFEDDFSDPNSGWGEQASDYSEKGYENDKYSILVKDTDVSSWSNPGLSFDDFILEVEATQVEGPDDNDYGVLVRYLNRDNFYYFAISGDGYYTVIKRQDGRYEHLVNWTESPHIKQGEQTNRLAVVAEGSRFLFYVNGEQVADVTDRSFSKGDIGLMAGSSDEVGVLIHFDNVKVWVEKGRTPPPTRAPTPTPTRTPTPTPTSTSGLIVAFEDDFSDPNSGWGQHTSASSEKGYEGGKYRIFIQEANSLSGSIVDESFDDFVLEVETTQVGGPDDNHYGVIVRYRDNDNFYYFAISGDGHYAVIKKQGGEYEHLVDWTESPHIRRGNQTNYLQIGTRGPLFLFYVNGEKMINVTDSSFSEGRIGLMAGSFDEAGVLIHFDNVKVWVEE